MPKLKLIASNLVFTLKLLPDSTLVLLIFVKALYYYN